MPPNPEIRASDSDRDRFAATLREHHAQGRLDLDEMHERLDATYAAKTLGELQRLTADLPEEDMYDLPVPARHRPMPARQRPHRGYQTAMKVSWRVWASVSLLNFLIWLIVSVSTVSLIYPWWIWVAGPWGAVLLIGQLFGPDDPGQKRKSLPPH